MRLSHGFVRSEKLACIFHGWQYDGAGSCVGIPAHPDLAPPKRAADMMRLTPQTRQGWVAQFAYGPGQTAHAIADERVVD